MILIIEPANPLQEIVIMLTNRDELVFPHHDAELFVSFVGLLEAEELLVALIREYINTWLKSRYLIILPQLSNEHVDKITQILIQRVQVIGKHLL